jgi:hypothetical protein
MPCAEADPRPRSELTKAAQSQIAIEREEPLSTN